MAKQLHALAQKVWDYHKLDHTLIKSDCIFVLCSNDVRVAEHAAQLYLDAMRPLLFFLAGSESSLRACLRDLKLSTLLR